MTDPLIVAAGVCLSALVVFVSATANLAMLRGRALDVWPFQRLGVAGPWATGLGRAFATAALVGFAVVSQLLVAMFVVAPDSTLAVRSLAALELLATALWVRYLRGLAVPDDGADDNARPRGRE